MKEWLCWVKLKVHLACYLAFDNDQKFTPREKHKIIKQGNTPSMLNLQKFLALRMPK